MTNTFSPAWFATFLDSIPAAHTAREIEFVSRHMPQPAFSRIMDLCCGSGRHAIPLAALGYHVVGVDANEDALHRARTAAPDNARATFVRGDLRDLAAIGGTFDGVVNLWHSFGFDDDDGNRAVLAGVHARLRDGGRAIFDIYNRAHYVTLALAETSERAGRRLHTARTWRGNRLHVAVRYDDGAPSDAFEWRLYDPDEFKALAESAGFRVLLSCAWFTESTPASAEHARMQFVLQRA